MPAAWEHTATL